MLINVDFSQLEFVVAAYLSRDPTALQEVKDGIDQHSLNQQAWNLPERRTAKFFVFRILYGGRQFSVDPMFMHISSDQRFWDNLIDNEFYVKYRGIRKWHDDLVRTVTLDGSVTMPTGRTYYFTPEYGNLPRPKILNYPVQGLAADLVAIARVSLYRRLLAAGLLSSCLMVSSIHDSIIVDIADKVLLSQVALMMQSVLTDVPGNFKKLFGVEFDLPLRGDISYGPTKADLVDWNA